MKDDYRVFYVTAWGYAADHLYGWFPKALNCHHDMFALLAHEGSRPKYLAERTRGERPELGVFTEFLNDMGMTYAAIGDCYSYRASQMPEILNNPRYQNIPVVNLVRHPVAWLEFYVRWRASNMRMGAGASNPLEWEWKTANHGYFDALGLRSYDKDDIEVWASFQGMFQLNNVLSDIQSVTQHIAIEKIADEPETFKKLVSYLGRNEVIFEQAILDTAYAMRDTLFRGESIVECEPKQLLGAWPGWKVDAFRQLVSSEALEAYSSFGYDLKEITRRPFIMRSSDKKVNRSVFVSSVPKSGSWLLREILQGMTGLSPHEPVITTDRPVDYENEMLIDFPKGCFFSWHSIITPRTQSLLISSQSKNIFLIRNVYDVLLSMLNHLVYDVDATIDRSILGSAYFEGKTVEECLTLIISGFNTDELNWKGAEPMIRQLDSMLEFVESGQALIIDYKELTKKKKKTIEVIQSFLEIELSAEKVQAIIEATEKGTMRDRLKKQGQDSHVSENKHSLNRDVFSEYHHDILEQIILVHAPELPRRLQSLGLGSIISLFDKPKTEFKQSIRRKIILLPANSKPSKYLRFFNRCLAQVPRVKSMYYQIKGVINN